MLCTQGWAGQTQHLFFWRRISQSEIRNPAAAESEGGQKLVPCRDTGFLPPNPLPFCPPAGNPQRFFRTAAGPQIGW